MDKKHITFIAIFLAIALILVSVLLIFNLDGDTEESLVGQAVEDEDLILFTPEDLEGVESPGELFSLLDLNNDGLLSYEEFVLGMEIIINQ